MVEIEDVRFMSEQEGYERQELPVGDSRDIMTARERGDVHPLIDTYPERDGSAYISVDQRMNEQLYDIGGDGNPIHYDDAFVQAYCEEFSGLQWEIPEGEYVEQGSIFAKAAVAHADGLVAESTHTFADKIVSGEAVILLREGTEDGERLSVYSADAFIEAEEPEPASVHDIVYATDDHGLTAEEHRVRNESSSMKVPIAVGADDQLNNLLVRVDADYGDGTGKGEIRHIDKQHVEPDRGVNLIDTYRMEDGTTVELGLLNPYEEKQQDIVENYVERVGIENVIDLEDLGAGRKTPITASMRFATLPMRAYAGGIKNASQHGWTPWSFSAGAMWATNEELNAE